MKRGNENLKGLICKKNASLKRAPTRSSFYEKSHHGFVEKNEKLKRNLTIVSNSLEDTVQENKDIKTKSMKRERKMII